MEVLGDLRPAIEAHTRQAEAVPAYGGEPEGLSSEAAPLLVAILHLLQECVATGGAAAVEAFVFDPLRGGDGEGGEGGRGGGGAQEGEANARSRGQGRGTREDEDEDEDEGVGQLMRLCEDEDEAAHMGEDKNEDTGEGEDTQTSEGQFARGTKPPSLSERTARSGSSDDMTQDGDDEARDEISGSEINTGDDMTEDLADDPPDDTTLNVMTLLNLALSSHSVAVRALAHRAVFVAARTLPADLAVPTGDSGAIGGGVGEGAYRKRQPRVTSIYRSRSFCHSSRRPPPPAQHPF